ncbi:MAG: head-tail connector protein [Tannerellaceae bacterium]|nr:head-tail connector protein [Tannerellaceae bacterium]
MLIELQEAKKHLVVDPDYQGDDEYIISLIDTAIDAVGLHIRQPLKEIAEEKGYLPSPLKAAVLLLVGNLYANREPVSYEEVNEIPYTYEYLLSLYLDNPSQV